MKRDFELIKKILLEVEALPNTSGINEIEIDGFSEEEIAYHVYLLGDAELLETEIHEDTSGTIYSYYIGRLTWQGHEFLDNARNDTTWKKTIAIVKEKGGSVSFNIFQNLLQSQATKLFEG